jgi:hypothetical protein
VNLRSRGQNYFAAGPTPPREAMTLGILARFGTGAPRRMWVLRCAIIAAPIMLVRAGPALADPPPPSPLTVVIKGAQIPQLLGVAESHLEILALRNRQTVPIPFQVDDVLPDGRYALPERPGPLAANRPGVLDRNDEIAMMFSDCGERVEAGNELPPGALEVEVLDKPRDARRYAYIAAVQSPRLSPISYVKYDPTEGRIDGAGYRMTFRGDFPVAFALKDRRGEASRSLIKGTAVQVTARVLTFFKMRLNGKGVTNHVIAWRAGPIRLIRRVSHRVKLVFGIRSPRVVSNEVFYRDYAEDSFVARVLWVPRVFFGDVRVQTALDFVGIHGFSLMWSSMGMPPLELDEANRAPMTEIHRNAPDARWLAIRGDGKIVVQTFMPSPDLALLRLQLYLCDGRPAPDAMEGCTDPTLQIGYTMSGWEKLSAGQHRLESVLMVLPETANPDRLTAELGAELVVHVIPAERSR